MELETGHYTAMRRTIPRSFPQGLLQDFQQIKPRHSTKIRKGKWPEDCGCGCRPRPAAWMHRRSEDSKRAFGTHTTGVTLISPTSSCPVSYTSERSLRLKPRTNLMKIPWTQCVVRRLVSDRTADAQRSQAKGSRVKPSETKLSRMKPSEAEPS